MSQIIAGSIVIAVGVIAIILRNRSIDARLKWYQEHFPRWPQNRALETIGYVFGFLVIVAFGVVLIVTAA